MFLVSSTGRFGLWFVVFVLSSLEAYAEVCADGLGNAEKVGKACVRPVDGSREGRPRNSESIGKSGEVVATQSRCALDESHKVLLCVYGHIVTLLKAVFGLICHLMQDCPQKTAEGQERPNLGLVEASLLCPSYHTRSKDVNETAPVTAFNSQRFALCTISARTGGVRGGVNR